jgi:hypothetical protein
MARYKFKQVGRTIGTMRMWLAVMLCGVGVAAA